MLNTSQAKTLGELIAQRGRATRSVKDELRQNLIARLQSGATLFPGIVGYDETVIPQVVNALLSKHNFILLGLRGQAKTRMLRALTTLLDDVIPVMPDCEIHDDPRAPICSACRAIIAKHGDATPIGWLPRDRRYVEKLATPDVTIADMIGDLDPIKAVRGGLDLADELTMHYGLLPRANRGIFAINELPDLAGKVQVGLFNILQEGDVQIKGYPVRLPLDLMIVFSANPEDYTARGKIITPLKDRIGSEIRTHYPASRADAMAITEQEAWIGRAAGSLPVDIPVFVREVVEEVAFQARGDQRVDKRSGVSQRLPITALENAVSNAERRAILAGETTIVPRVTDVYAALPSLTGKIELEYEGELRGADVVARDLVRGAIATVFDGYAAMADLTPIIEWFEGGGTLQLSDDTSAKSLLEQAAPIDGLERALGQLGVAAKKSAEYRAAGFDFILEGLVSVRKISRTEDGRMQAPPSDRKARNPERDRAIDSLMRESEGNDGGHAEGVPGRGKKKYYNEIERPVKYQYTKFVPGLIDELDFDQLMSKLSDFFLSSGFGNPYDPLNEDDRTLQALHDAILDALLNGGMLSDEMINQLLSQNADGKDAETRDALEQLIQQIIERLTEQGFISMGDQPSSQRRVGPGGDGPIDPNARFEVTDKGLDFLGYRALRDLLGALGRSAAGRHDTRDLATGVDAGGAPREYEFGDTMNLDAAATILKSVQRHKGLGTVDYSDLMISQGEFQSSCATVIMLDCSHSMVLYGEDRFTPAKRVAMALANMIQHQFPGDVIRAVLFHDSAEEVPIKELGRVKVGPYYTNTREGLRVARRILERQRKDMKQIIMITDGKPSAITRPDGQIYRNPNGLDPYVLRETFSEVAACRKAGIMINTFMLARDYDLVAFVRRVARVCRGKAYFTTPHTLGQYVLADFLTNKTRTVH